jgi:hypothetical protein
MKKKEETNSGTRQTEILRDNDNLNSNKKTST